MHNVNHIKRRLDVLRLSSGQLALLDSILDTFEQPVEISRMETSDVVDEEFAEAFGDFLKLHHSLSADYLSKYRFEAAMERLYQATGRDAIRPARCNPGHDITVDDVAWSLKTQGNRNIRKDRLHISKFMELGKGRWENEKDLVGLRRRFLAHMRNYERIFQLRYFQDITKEKGVVDHLYEMVEIPKKLLLESRRYPCEMRQNSKQTPKPGYCTVRDAQGVRFELYFDGGTERKLQIKNIRKTLCKVHGTWRFIQPISIAASQSPRTAD